PFPYTTLFRSKDGESARGDRLHRGNFPDGKAAEFFSATEQRPRERRSSDLAQPGIFAEPGVVVGRFAKIGKRRFGDHRIDARIGRAGLQGDARAHRLPERENMARRANRPAEAVPLDRKAALLGVMKQRVDDGAGVVAFEPAVRGDGAVARAMAARVQDRKSTRLNSSHVSIS